MKINGRDFILDKRRALGPSLVPVSGKGPEISFRFDRENQVWRVEEDRMSSLINTAVFREAREDLTCAAD